MGWDGPEGLNYGMVVFTIRIEAPGVRTLRAEGLNSEMINSRNLAIAITIYIHPLQNPPKGNPLTSNFRVRATHF